MSETSTFSALVDEAILRSQRRDRIADIVSYARSTIRECQVLAFFEQDMIEDSLTVDVLPFQWARPLNLRTLLAAKPNEVTTRRGKDIWFKNRPPGEDALSEWYFLYLSGDTFIFSGTELVLTDVIDIAYFTYSRKFIYYATADRPATYDPETETWSYSEDYTTTAEQETARALVQNWLLKYWYDLVLEGVLAKIFKTVGDERSRTAFALFKSMQKDLLSGERVIYLRDKPDSNG
jgi:hypothetical protein